MAVSFFEYVDRKERDAIRELKVVRRILKHGGFQVAAHLSDKGDDPFLFVYNPDSAPSFGLRVYKLGGDDKAFGDSTGTLDLNAVQDTTAAAAE